MKIYYEWHVASNPAHVPPLVKEVLAVLGKNFSSLTQEEYGDIKLILYELMYNAVMHGNSSDESKSVHVEMSAAGKELRVSIKDEGSGFNPADAMVAGKERLSLENGRGITLVSALADEITYSDEGRRVTFLKYIGARPPVLTGV